MHWSRKDAKSKKVKFYYASLVLPFDNSIAEEDEESELEYEAKENYAEISQHSLKLLKEEP
ncbi:hypothetical protein ACTXT7_009991 [Hymenolepis weldensis]